MSADWVLRYRPAGPATEAFHASDAFVRGLMGPIGGGKSTACCMEILRRALAQPVGTRSGLRRTRWAVVRNTLPQLKTTTIKTWSQWLPDALGRWTQGPPPTHRLLIEDVDCEVMFLALDRPEDARKVLSLELTGAWINEAREVPRAILDALTGRVGRFPEQADGGPGWCGIIMDTNPPDLDHWWARMALTDRPDGWEFFAQGAGDGPAAENLQNLPQGYYERAKAGKSDDWVRVYVRGDYGWVRDGKAIYPEYCDRVHAAPGPLVAMPGVPLLVGVDFGLTPAAAICQRTPRGQWRILAELTTENMGAARFGELLAAELARRFPGWEVALWGDPAGAQRAQTDERSALEILSAASGLEARPAPANDFTTRREAVAAALNRLVDGDPGLVLSPECGKLRAGFAGRYRWRQIAASGSEPRYDAKPDKNAWSHVHDALQYAFLGGGDGAATRRPRSRSGLGATAHHARVEYDVHGWG